MDMLEMLVTGIIFFVLFVIGASFESLLMFTSVRDRLVSRFGEKGAYNLYNILMMVGTLPCFVFFVYAAKYVVPGTFDLPRYSIAVGAALIVAGLLTVYSSVRVLKRFRWLGHDIFGIASEEDKLIVEGIYKHIRHPTFLGAFLIFYGVFFIVPVIMILIAVISYNIYIVLIHTRFEEKHLIEKFGDEYTAYMEQTPAFIPRPWRTGGKENESVGK